MSLLLALTSSGGSGVTGTAVTSQAQTVAITGTTTVAAVSGTLAASQAQTVVSAGSFTAAGGVSGTDSTSQAQTVDVVGVVSAPSVTGTTATSQAQTIAASGTSSVSGINGAAATSQGETVAASGSSAPQAVTGTTATSEAQTITSSGSFVAAGGVSGSASTSQAQTVVSAGVVEGGTTAYSGEVILQRKKIYVKRGKQYLIFNNAQEADSYLAAEQAIETAKKSSRGAAKRVIKALKVVKPEIVEAPKLEAIETLLARFNVQFDAIQAQKNNDIEALIAIQSMLYELQQDEDDIELLLLSM
jgi:hypothetical protein